MAIRYRKAIFILKKIKPSLLLLISALLLTATGILAIFSKLEMNQTASIMSILSSLLRDESNVSNSYLISKSLEDLHKVGVLHCALLKRVSTHQHNIFYDSTFKDNCVNKKLTTNRLEGLDGQQWELSILPRIEPSFYVLKWLTLLVFIASIVAIYWVISNRFTKEKQKRIHADERRRFLENLASQVRHDVASPMTALKIISEKAPLDDQTRTFLKQIISRTDGIFNSLSISTTKNGIINIDTELQKIISEKQLSWGKCPWIKYEKCSSEIKISEIEFGRAISNLLNNAKEANATIINIRFEKSERFLTLKIGDNGSDIPSSILRRLGEIGNTSGKKEGRGLGISHVYQLMSSIGGRLEMNESGDSKVLLYFPLSRLVENFPTRI